MEKNERNKLEKTLFQKIRDAIIILFAIGYIGSIAYFAIAKGNSQAMFIIVAVVFLIGVPVSVIRYRQSQKTEASERQKSLHEIFKNKEFKIIDNYRSNYLVSYSDEKIRVAYIYIFTAVAVYGLINGLFIKIYFFETTCAKANCLPAEFVIALNVFLFILGTTILYRYVLRWHFNKVIISKSNSAIVDENGRNQELESLEIKTKYYGKFLKTIVFILTKGKLSLNTNYTLVFNLKNGNKLPKFNSSNASELEQLKNEIKKLSKI